MKNSINLPRHSQDSEEMQRLSDKVSFLKQLREQDESLYLRQISPIKDAIQNNREYEGFSGIQLREIIIQLEVDLGHSSTEMGSVLVENRGEVSRVLPGRTNFSN